MAIALSKEKVQAQNGLMMIYSFFALLGINILVLVVANTLFPTTVVLGTFSISYMWAIYHSMFKLTVIGIFAMQLVYYYEWKKGITFTPKQWTIAYFVVNLVSIWGITRFAENLGFGVSSWFVVLLLAAAFDLAEGVVMMQMSKLIKMK